MEFLTCVNLLSDSLILNCRNTVPFLRPSLKFPTLKHRWLQLYIYFHIPLLKHHAETNGVRINPLWLEGSLALSYGRLRIALRGKKFGLWIKRNTASGPAYQSKESKPSEFRRQPSRIDNNRKLSFGRGIKNDNRKQVWKGELSRVRLS